MPNSNDSPNRAIAETENYIDLGSHGTPMAKSPIHIELGAVTLHFFREEWDEFLQLTKAAASNR